MVGTSCVNHQEAGGCEKPVPGLPIISIVREEFDCECGCGRVHAVDRERVAQLLIAYTIRSNSSAAGASLGGARQAGRRT
eukprot:7229497-Heterocapsa_arctica.AAC.1